MVTNKKFLSFGRYLKNARLEKGISLDEISNETKIGIDKLLLIEKEDHDELPAEVFVKGFVRAYAKAIGADGDEAIKLYLSGRHIFEEKARFEADLIQSSSKFWPHLFISIGALLCIMTLSILVMSVSHKNAPIEVQSKPETIQKKNMPVKATTAPEKKETVIQHPQVILPEKLHLKILTVEKTWLKVIIDDHKTKEYSLNPGDRLELAALSGFNLLIGNATGVKLTLNDQPLDIPGKSGQVVTIRIP